MTRTCTIRAGMMLFIPILNSAFGAGLGDCLGPPGNVGPCDVGLLRQEAAAAVDMPATLEASIDGTSLRELASYRVRSPVFSYTVTSDNLTGALAGVHSPAVSDGYWLMLRPLSPGPHTIHVKGVSSPSAGSFEAEVTYLLTVVEEEDD